MTARTLWLVVGIIGCWTWIAYVGAMMLWQWPANGIVDLMLMGGLAAFARAKELGP